MVEPGIVQGMVEYVAHAVLDLHRDMPAYRRAQERRQWQPLQVRTLREALLVGLRQGGDVRGVDHQPGDFAPKKRA